MSDLSIAAIIPLYNGARWIEQTIRSVLAQTVQPDEFIVVDDGSTDGGTGAAIAEQLGVTVLRKPNGGQSSARNYGVAHSTSALIALLDQDDAWYPHHLERLVRSFRRSSQGVPLGWVYSDLDEVDESGGVIHRNFLTSIHTVHPKMSLAECLTRDMFILPSASLISREAFEAIGRFDERLCGYEDDDLFLRLFRAGYRSEYVGEALSQWRIYPSSTSYSPRMAKSRMIYARKLMDAYPDNPRQRRYWTKHCIAPRFFRTSAGEFLQAVRDGKRDVAWRALADMAEMAAHMRMRTRVLFRLFKPLMRSMWLARGLTCCALINYRLQRNLT